MKSAQRCKKEKNEKGLEEKIEIMRGWERGGEEETLKIVNLKKEKK